MMKHRGKNDLIEWFLPSQLACGGSPHLNAKDSVRKEVDWWIDQVKTSGLRSVICLLGDSELETHYGAVPGGLIHYVSRNGLEVRRVPAADYQSPPLRGSHLQAVWAAFQELPKPVLVQCLRGISRSRHAADFIARRVHRAQHRPRAASLFLSLPLLARLFS